MSSSKQGKIMNFFWKSNGVHRVSFFLIVSVAVIASGHLDKIRNGRRNRMIGRRIGGREEFKPKVCFDLLGCFSDPALPLKRPPEHPSVIQTRFLLYTRERIDAPEVVAYGDATESMRSSHFNATRKLKVIIHGFKGSGSDPGAIFGAKSLLELEDANVIIVDWAKGAGTTYQAAVANTELVGRQLALVLLDAVKLGTSQRDIHAMGFSLGAHVAGCASEMLKKKNLLIGRITGLDPASPLFRRHLVRERSRKLDVTDASLVDVIHTDGSDDFSDGFGLLKPMGHIDFFPNGGKEQPGCNDVKNSVVYSHFHEEVLDRDIACSHLRAWQMFVETVRSQSGKCKFTAWPCPQGADSFERGTCFPLETVKWSQEMGYAADHGALGIYYLPTRAEPPFCGDPIRAAVIISEDAPRTSGTLYLKIKHANSTTTVPIRCEFRRLNERNEARTAFYRIAAVEFQSITDKVDTIEGSIWYQVDKVELEEESSNTVSQARTIQLDKMIIEDRRGNRWEHCRAKTTVGTNENSVMFHNRACTIN
ncbi:pancreatic lipase-related protein 2-like isoform X2 [Venturia canescens]|uniref:pancreatic lipase-related protein 2-like isoform X2 n=1 Tax=Venturia canescens TaxID=32260 RepID=UPI001C9D63DE|nr:pancreatic lipase-related protein 2-like isoform X2 [Venturia canescens]